MQVFLTEWLLIFPGSPAALAAFTWNFPIASFPRGLLQYHICDSGFLLWLIARKNGESMCFIFSRRWAENFLNSFTGQRSFFVACAFGLNALWWVPSPCLVFDPLSAFHTRTSPPCGSFSRTMSPHLNELWIQSATITPTKPFSVAPQGCGHRTPLCETTDLLQMGWNRLCRLWTISLSVLFNELAFLTRSTSLDLASSISWNRLKDKFLPFRYLWMLLWNEDREAGL